MQKKVVQADLKDGNKKLVQVSEEPKIRVKIKAYDNKIIDNATRTIIDTAQRNGCRVIGPVPLPTEIRKYSVNRATFVHKKNAEQYEMRVHKRLLDIYETSPKAIDALMNLNLPSGVDVEIKMS
jgi:small subunit ribosomal protein S10